MAPVTEGPTKAPTKMPTKAPTKAPTKLPTMKPVNTAVPTSLPSKSPTFSPVVAHSISPSAPHHHHTNAPAIAFTNAPTVALVDYSCGGGGDSNSDSDSNSSDEQEVSNIEFSYQVDLKKESNWDPANLIRNIENILVDLVGPESCGGGSRARMRRLKDDKKAKIDKLIAAPADYINDSSPCEEPYDDSTNCFSVSGKMQVAFDGVIDDYTKDNELNEIFLKLKDNMDGRHVVKKFGELHDSDLVRVKYTSPVQVSKAPTPSPNDVNKVKSQSFIEDEKALSIMVAITAGLIVAIILAFIVTFRKRRKKESFKNNKSIGAYDYPIDDCSDDSETYLSKTPSPPSFNPRKKSFRRNNNNEYDDDEDNIMVHRGAASLSMPFELPSWFNPTFDEVSENDITSEQQSVGSYDMETIHNVPGTKLFTSADFPDGDDSSASQTQNVNINSTYQDSVSF